MAASKKMDKTGTEYDKASLKRTPVLFPPPAWASPGQHGLVPKYGIGGGRGLLPKYQTAEEMEHAIQTYFAYVEDNDMAPTMAGLSLAIGFKSRQALQNYEKKGEDFAYIIEVARTRIEDWKNRQLNRTDIKNVNGYIFDLKNHHGYVDRFEQRTTHEMGDTLTRFLTELQGTVLRPAAALTKAEDEAIDAEFTVSDSFRPKESAVIEDEYEGLV